METGSEKVPLLLGFPVPSVPQQPPSPQLDPRASLRPPRVPSVLPALHGHLAPWGSSASCVSHFSHQVLVLSHGCPVVQLGSRDSPYLGPVLHTGAGLSASRMPSTDAHSPALSYLSALKVHTLNYCTPERAHLPHPAPPLSRRAPLKTRVYRLPVLIPVHHLHCDFPHHPAAVTLNSRLNKTMSPLH